MPFVAIPLSPNRKTGTASSTSRCTDYVKLIENDIKAQKAGLSSLESAYSSPFIAYHSATNPICDAGDYSVCSEFYANGGFYREIGRSTPTPYDSIHVRFTLQGVHQTESQSEDSMYTLYAPLFQVILNNGIPEMLRDAEIYFVSTDRPIYLHGALLIEKVHADDLGLDFTRAAPDGRILMADSITHNNTESALRKIDIIKSRLGEHPALSETVGHIRSSSVSPADMVVMRNVLAAEAMHTSPSFYFKNNGENCFLTEEQSKKVAGLITTNFSKNTSFQVGVGPYSTTIGAQMRNMAKMDDRSLAALASDTTIHPDVRRFANEAKDSVFFRKIRACAILDEFMDKSATKADKEGTPQRSLSYLFTIIDKPDPDGLIVDCGIISSKDANYIFQNELNDNEKSEVSKITSLNFGLS